MATLSTFFDMVYVNATESSGHGPFMLGTAVTGFQTAAAAGITNGTPVSYKATDGTNWETAHGVIDVSGSVYTLTRGVDTIKSSNSNALVNFGSGVVVCLTELSQDFVSMANPTAVVGLTAVNGLATSAMRSDGAPAIASTILKNGGVATNWFFANSGNATATGTGNLAIGDGALAALTTGTGNDAIGLTALNKLTTGTENFAMGTNALASSVTDYFSVAIGIAALAQLNGGGYVGNTAIGGNAGYTLTSGGYNTFIGYSTGAASVATGSYNTIIGAQVAGLAAGLSGAIILATGDGVIHLDYGNTTASTWTMPGALNVGGAVSFGTYTATPGTITGYITIKDSGGTSRKLAVTT